MSFILSASPSNAIGGQKSILTQLALPLLTYTTGLENSNDGCAVMSILHDIVSKIIFRVTYNAHV